LTSLIEGDVEVRNGALDLVPVKVHCGTRLPADCNKSMTNFQIVEAM
jgi:hypothetical protein